jgi:hypothetical protein
MDRRITEIKPVLAAAVLPAPSQDSRPIWPARTAGACPPAASAVLRGTAQRKAARIDGQDAHQPGQVQPEISGSSWPWARV